MFRAWVGVLENARDGSFRIEDACNADPSGNENISDINDFESHGIGLTS